jgi:hypothetical protein
LTLSQLQPGTKVVAGGNTIVVGGDGQVMVPIRSGTSTIAWQR